MSGGNKVDIPKGAFRALVRIGERSAMGSSHRGALSELGIEGIKAFSDDAAPIVQRLLAVTDDVDMAIVTRDLVDGNLVVSGNSGTFGLPKTSSIVRPKTLTHLQSKYSGEKVVGR